MTYNGIGAVNKIEHLENNNLVLEEFFEYNSGTIVRNYRKKNLGTNLFADVAFTTNPTTYSNNEWQWSYRQSALGGREQKRLLTSPHSDETAIGGKIFAHLWEYSLLGAGGEELIFYKGFQVNTNTSAPSNDAGRRVYMGVQRYMVNGGEIQINANGEMELHITDHLGNVRVITNKTGTVLKKFDYKPFGEILWSNSPTPRKGFESAELDSENGYITMGARTYCQDIGRFLQPDPLFEAFARHTPYHYSFNSPLVWLDPSGLAPEKEKGEERLLNFEPEEYEQGEMSYFMMRSQLTIGANYERMIEESNLLMSFRTSRLGAQLSNLGFGFTVEKDGDNFTLKLIAENEDGVFSVEAEGCIDSDGTLLFNSFESRVNVDGGINIGKWLDGLQTALDVYSMADQGIGGAIASVISAAIDVHKGNYSSAAVGILSAIPIFGIAADLAKAEKIASQITETGMKYGAKFGSLADDAGELTIKMADDIISSNYNRFISKIPANSKASATKTLLEDGNYLFEAVSPAKNIPGSYAKYQKWVDPSGKTTKYLKTTYGPDGQIIHIKNK